MNNDVFNNDDFLAPQPEDLDGLHEAEMNEREADAEDITESAEWEYWNPVEQGMYDDDPSPYDGNYSEM